MTRRLGISALVYLAGDVAVMAGGFLVTVLLVRHLPVADYGILAAVNMFAMVVSGMMAPVLAGSITHDAGIAAPARPLGQQEGDVIHYVSENGVGKITGVTRPDAARLYTREDLERYRDCPNRLEPEDCKKLCGPNCTGSLARPSTERDTAKGGA